MNNELIKINHDNDRPTVLGRDLHKYLEVTERYSNWFERMCQYGFSENTDYLGCKVFNTLARQELQDHQLTIEMAKEISMLQRTDKGKEARQYFINLEKAWNTPELVMARALKLADVKIKSLETQIEEQKPLVLFAETVTKSCDNILMRDMAKLCCDQNINIGEKRLYKILRKEEILMSDNTPYQSYIDRQYFVVKESTITTPYGEKLNKTTLVTPKGQIWIVGKLSGWIENK